MSFNFVEERYFPKILSDRVTRDGYEVTNLVSSKNPGFLAESFIKPPVTVTIKFPCNINIARIIVNGKVGGQKSTGFEICTASFRRRSTWMFACGAAEDDLMSFDDKIYLKVGRGYDAAGRHLFVFVNKRFSGSTSIEYKTSQPEFQLYHNYERHLSAVSALAIRVTSTLNGSAVAIGAIEVWGEPSGDVQKELVEHIRHISASSDDAGLPSAEAGTASRFASRSTDLTSIGTVNLSADVPEEFLDAITQDLMSLPVLLPSGQTIDQTTLDRYLQEESRWGRSPSDPFTFRPFSSLCRPLQNIPLKARIDEFLLKHLKEHAANSVSVSGLVGRGNGKDQSCSRLIETPLSKAVTKDTESKVKFCREGAESSAKRLRMRAEPVDKRNDVDGEQVRNRKTNPAPCFEVLPDELDSNRHNCQNKRIKLDPELESGRARGSPTSTLRPLLGVNEDKASELHEDKLRTSLESALHSALLYLPSFTKNCSKNGFLKSGPISSTAGCVKCKAEAADQMYRLKCSHCICRQCLLCVVKTERSCHCMVCNAVINYQDAVKIHLTKTDFLMNPVL